MVMRQRRKSRVLPNVVQDKSVPGVRAEKGVVLRNAGVVRYAALDPTQFLLCHAHVQSGKEPPKGCICRTGRLAPLVRVVEQELPDGDVGEGAGIDAPEPTAFAFNSEFWGSNEA